MYSLVLIRDGSFEMKWNFFFFNQKFLVQPASDLGYGIKIERDLYWELMQDIIVKICKCFTKLRLIIYPNKMHTLNVHNHVPSY